MHLKSCYSTVCAKYLKLVPLWANRMSKVKIQSYPCNRQLEAYRVVRLEDPTFSRHWAHRWQ
jgi:hypothetical protein